MQVNAEQSWVAKEVKKRKVKKRNKEKKRSNSLTIFLQKS